MQGLNECRFIGRLTDNVSLRTNSDGKNYCYFTVAINRGKKTDKDGNSVERPPLYLDFSANGGYAQVIATYGKKGMPVYIGGELDKTQRCVEKDGVKTVYNDIVVRVNKCILLPYGDSKNGGTNKAEQEENGASGTPVGDGDFSSADAMGYSPAGDFAEPTNGDNIEMSESERRVSSTLPF